MKNYRPENDQSMVVFYVMLDEPLEKKPKAMRFTPVSRGHLSLIVNR